MYWVSHPNRRRNRRSVIRLSIARATIKCLNILRNSVFIKYQTVTRIQAYNIMIQTNNSFQVLFNRLTRSIAILDVYHLSSSIPVTHVK